MATNNIDTRTAPYGRTSLDAEVLEWVWRLPTTHLRQLLTNSGLGSEYPPYRIDTPAEAYWFEARALAIRLIVEADAGQPGSASEFLNRCNPPELAIAWGGKWDDTLPWTGVPGVDQLIAAVINDTAQILPRLLVEFYNVFRDWAEHPSEPIAAARGLCIPETFINGADMDEE